MASLAWLIKPQVRAVGTDEGACSVLNRYQRWLLLAIFTLLVVFRLPHAWAHGRFLDEEATVFLAYAWHSPWLTALLRPFGGYLNLGANSITVLVAKLVKSGTLSLEWAPYLTMLMALLVQMFPAMLILTGKARWLARRQAVIFALLIIALAPSTEEVFFNVMHIQFHLSLCVALILAIDIPKRRIEKVCYAVLLFLTPLCGLAAIVLLPLYALRTFVDRDRERAKQLALLTAGAAAQLLFFYGTSQARSHPRDLPTVAATMFVRMIMLPAIGPNKANHVGDVIYQSQMIGDIRWWGAAIVAVLLFGGLIVLAVQRKNAAIWLALSGIIIAISTFSFGMILPHYISLFHVTDGERYNFLPLTLIGLSLIALSAQSAPRAKRVYTMICLLWIIVGAVRYPKPLYTFNSGPSWPKEVAAWRSDHNHLLAVWPSQYAADLSDNTRPCSPVTRDLTKSTDPRYCESAWTASFYEEQHRH